ncbi:MAG: sigma factor [Blautia wexlerae]
MPESMVESEIDDLMQEGYLGMYRAVGNYDLSAGTSFLSSCRILVKQCDTEVSPGEQTHPHPGLCAGKYFKV